MIVYKTVYYTQNLRPNFQKKIEKSRRMFTNEIFTACILNNKIKQERPPCKISIKMNSTKKYREEVNYNLEWYSRGTETGTKDCKLAKHKKRWI